MAIPQWTTVFRMHPLQACTVDRKAAENIEIVHCFLAMLVAEGFFHGCIVFLHRHEQWLISHTCGGRRVDTNGRVLRRLDNEYR